MAAPRQPPPPLRSPRARPPRPQAVDPAPAVEREVTAAPHRAPPRPAAPRPADLRRTPAPANDVNHEAPSGPPAVSGTPAAATRELASTSEAESAPPVQPSRGTERQPKRRLGEVLVDAGVVSDADVMRALAVQKMGGGRLGAILVKLKLVSDQQIRRALAEQLGMEVVDFDGMELDETVLKLLPRELIKKYEAIPVRVADGALYVAMKDPYNFTAVDDIRFYANMRVVVLACTESDYAAFVSEHLETQCLIEEILEGGTFYDKAISSVDGFTEEVEVAETEETDEIVHDLRLAGEHPPIITLCNFLLVESIQRRASDIHIEPYETYFRVRIRVDGRLQTLLTPPQRLHGPIITRMKILAEMDISVRRAPQDGHIALVFRGETCHYRVSTLPTVYGEKCVIRLLKKDAQLTELDTLGFPPDLLKSIKRSLGTSQGLILVTGPTGSGKTTTLHAGLTHINDPDTNIVTLEDPVEASLPGINHVQINEKAGISFSSGLKSILRQDPDVVFVGEMRDPEVSRIAIKAALTGHLVLSTLHTNSAAESLMRLEDMGVPTYLLANALLLVVAQRLVRRVCKMCAEPYEPDADDLDDFGLSPEILETATLRRGKGCDACFETGYRGRQAVYEALIIDNDLRSLVRHKKPVEEIIRTAEAKGMVLLFEAGKQQALRGETTLAEVRRCLTDAR